MPTGGGGGSSTPKGWPLTQYNQGGNNAPLTVGGANQVYVVQFQLPYQLTFSHITTYVTVADAVHNTDMGIYSNVGNLLANIGGQAISGTAFQGAATLQGMLTLNPGLYLYALVSAGTTFQIGFTNQGYTQYRNSNGGTGVAGTLPATVTAPTITADANIPWFQLY